jgi:hypothetical protein
MKIVSTSFFILFAVFSLLLSDIFSQTINPGFITEEIRVINLSETRNVEDSAKNLPWSNSVFISGGYGSQQGLIFELGYNIGSYVSLAAILGMHNKWTGHEKVTLGIIGKIHFLHIESISNYILIGYGGAPGILGGSDTYFMIHLGSKIPFADWLYLCPEFGPFFASDYISGGRGLFGGSSPEVYQSKILMGFNISLEIDFRQIF